MLEAVGLSTDPSAIFEFVFRLSTDAVHTRLPLQYGACFLPRKTRMPLNPNTFISQHSLEIDASGIRKVFDLAAKLKDPINLSIGQPDFDVPDPLKEKAIAAIRAGKNRYTPTQGIAELITALQPGVVKSHRAGPIRRC